MNVVLYLLERFQGLDFVKQVQQDYASVNVEKATSAVNMVRCFVVEVVFVAVYSDIPVLACHVDEFVCDLHLAVFAILLAHWKYVVIQPHHFLPIRCRIFVTVVVCY